MWTHRSRCRPCRIHPHVTAIACGGNHVEVLLLLGVQLKDAAGLHGVLQSAPVGPPGSSSGVETPAVGWTLHGSYLLAGSTQLRQQQLRGAPQGAAGGAGGSAGVAERLHACQQLVAALGAALEAV
jgi:hypothetical protein